MPALSVHWRPGRVGELWCVPIPTYNLSLVFREGGQPEDSSLAPSRNTRLARPKVMFAISRLIEDNRPPTLFFVISTITNASTDSFGIR